MLLRVLFAQIGNILKVGRELAKICDDGAFHLIAYGFLLRQRFVCTHLQL